MYAAVAMEPQLRRGVPDENEASHRRREKKTFALDGAGVYWTCTFTAGVPMPNHIVRDGDTGQAIVASTGTRVEDILAAMEAGAGINEVLRRFPGLSADAVRAALRFARMAVAREIPYRTDRKRGVSELRERAVRPYGRGGATALPSEGDDVLVLLHSVAAQRERLRHELEVAGDIHAGLEDVAAGRVITHEEVVARLSARFRG